jgi:capsular polysaccharide biosynthesis protein
MDLWTYLRALVRWWWLLFLVPLIALALSFFVFFPSAPWQTSWTTLVTFEGNPQKASSFNFIDYIVLDDMEHLLKSDVLGDRVYMNLPEEITQRYTRDEIGDMYSSYRHARFVKIWVTGEDPEVLATVAKTTEAVLPEAVNEYLVPADNANFPGMVETMDEITAPVQLTKDRFLKIGAVTAAGGAAALGLVGAAEWLRLNYRAKYAAR